MSPVVIVLIFVAVLLAVVILQRMSQSALVTSLETFQKNLLVLQKESERTADQKADALREQLHASVLSMTQNGFQHFERLQEQLLHLGQVGQSITDLNRLLKLPHLRGNFGEAILENLLSDLVPRNNYELQYRIVPGSTERVDAVIKYPSCVLPIDSKFPREQVMPLFETDDPHALEAARKTLGEVLRAQAKSIREKYIRPEHGTTEMALMFLPSETLYFEVLRSAKLGEELAKQKVFAVSPNTLAVTLHAIGMARTYYDMAQGVEETMQELRKARNHYESFEKRFEEIGQALNRAQSAFQTASTHLSRYDGAVARLTGAAEGAVDNADCRATSPWIQEAVR